MLIFDAQGSTTYAQLQCIQRRNQDSKSKVTSKTINIFNTQKRFRDLKLAINHNTKKVVFFHSSIIHQHRAEIFSQSTRIELYVLLNPKICPRVIVNQIPKKFIEKNDFPVELD